MRLLRDLGAHGDGPLVLLADKAAHSLAVEAAPIRQAGAYHSADEVRRGAGPRKASREGGRGIQASGVRDYPDPHAATLVVRCGEA